MPKNRRTSQSIAKVAAQLLNNKSSSKKVKQVSASVLSQRAPKK